METIQSLEKKSCNLRKRKINTQQTSNKKQKIEENDSEAAIDYGNKPLDQWFSAGKTRNFALQNELDDWLNMYHHKLENYNSFDTNTNIFVKHLMEKGHDFEAKVVPLLIQRVGADNFLEICKYDNTFYKNAFQYENATCSAMKTGIPVIYQGVVMNRTGALAGSYGIPDLIVRSDFLFKIIDKIPSIDVKKKAPNLNGDYHYVVIDIKWTTLEFCADGERLRKVSSIPAYKSQLYIYNHAIGTIQGYEPESSYILGRRWRLETTKGKLKGNNCFDRLGCIDYANKDSDAKNDAINAIKWLKELKSDGDKWELYPMPTHPNLYPNMSCIQDSNWDDFKISYAKEIGEITLLWNCGPSNRREAHRNGIKSYRDPTCSASLLGIKGPKQGPILDHIIHINQKEEFKDSLDHIMLFNENGVDNQWNKDEPLRISIDFETVNSIFDDFQTMPHAEDNGYIFMIGVSHKLKNQEPVYKMFLASELSREAEFQLIKEMYKYLRCLTDEHVGEGKRIPPLYHWGHYEESTFVRLSDQLMSVFGEEVSDNIMKIDCAIRWYNLLDVFKKNPIVINGCFGFGLKEIANRLHELGLIKTTWEADNPCKNGNNAMILAHAEYKKYNARKRPIIESDVIHDIMRYNRVDCNVIHDIIDVLRKKIEKS